MSNDQGQDTRALVAEIREALAGITPGQWKMLDGWGPFHTDGKHRCARIGTSDAPVFSPSGPYGAHDIIGRKEDFEFVARAPEWLATLCTALEEAETVIRKTAHDADTTYKIAAGSDLRSLAHASRFRLGEWLARYGEREGA